MVLRRLGTTDLRVTPLGLGLAALGRPGYINLGHAADLERTYEVAAMEARTHSVLDAAYDAGIRYVDAARSYGRAEPFLGRWLLSRDLAPGAVAVGSKWGYTYTADWAVGADVHEVKEHSIAVLERQWLESQRNLGDHLKLYQVHSATLESGILDNLTVLRELARLRASGVAIGLTVSGALQNEVIDRALQVTIDGVQLFQTVQATWNLLETSASAALARAACAGCGVIIKEALANGRLTQKNDGPRFAVQMRRLRRQAQRLSTSVDALALAAAIAQPWATMVLSGAARLDHLASNLRALTVEWDEEAAEALAPLREAPDDYWEYRSSLAWN